MPCREGAIIDEIQTGVIEQCCMQRSCNEELQQYSTCIAEERQKTEGQIQR